VIIAQSFRRKAIVTAIAAGGFASLYEANILDSRFTAAPPPAETLQPPSPGDHATFTATAYCKGQTTASGVRVRTGIAASDPTILPVGSVIDVTARDPKYSGIYTVMDTGPAVQGRHIDIYMWSCYEALDFGRMPIELTVLRLGWNPQATTPTFFERLFRRQTPPRQATPESAAQSKELPPNAPVPPRPAANVAADPLPGVPAVDGVPATDSR
jgi:3D (Asp-Asp-Asp) domain-containing protein